MSTLTGKSQFIPQIYIADRRTGGDAGSLRGALMRSASLQIYMPQGLALRGRPD